MSAGSSSAVMASPPAKYDVFLSFRGEDTRDNFTSHLFDRLCRKNIHTFIDYRLNKGDEISPELNKAIEESMIYVIILSEDYASSRWCLDELVKIQDCSKRDDQRHVIPVFYKVDPSIVRHQRETYAEAFLNHKNRFPEEVILKWKAALNKVADLSGWDSNVTRPEARLVGGIVQDILEKLGRSFSADNAGMVGIEQHIAQFQSFLQPESAGVRIIGMYGMGGIGKSTLARALYHKLGTQFSSRSCVINAQQEIERVGIDSLRKQFLSELLEEDIPLNGLHFAIERVKRARVLLILDDMKNSSHVQELIGGHGNFGQGSRIIVTSRDMQVLKNAEADQIYDVNEMNHEDSLELFSLYAFKQICPVEGFADLVEKVLHYAKGVPLALRVLGSLLYGRTRKAWESELQKLQNLPDLEIFNVLKLSYDGLDDEQKNIFLDIACFYAGGPVGEVVELLDNCGFCTNIGMDVLRDKGLISILGDQILVHDLLLDMGIEIVRQECVNDPGKRSRLWKHQEIYHVLRNNTGTDAIHYIFLDMSLIEKVELHPKVFKSMPNMRMLCVFMNYGLKRPISNVILPALLESLPDGLRVLHWEEFPQRSLPLDFSPQNLVRLEMPKSRLEQLWQDDKELPNLKWLNLSESPILIRIPDLSKSPNIEEILLTDCASLTSLPIDLCKMKLLRRLDLSGISYLKKFPEIKEKMENLAVLVLDRTEIQELPSSLHHLVGLEELSLRFCRNLKIIPSSVERLTKLCKLELMSCVSLETFPSSIFKLKLTKLDLEYCSMLKTFPEILEPVESFAHVVLSHAAIKELPSSLDYLVGLQTLRLDRCRDLESLPNSIVNLSLLSELSCSGCGELTEIPNDIGRLSSLRRLLLEETGIVNLPESIAHLSSLESLDVSDCRELECIPQLPTSLKKLLAFNCPSIRRVMPNSRFKHPSDSKEGTFKLYFTNDQNQDPRGHSDVMVDARIRINEDANRFVFYCFPGSVVPDWFPYRCEGNSVTVDKDSLHWSDDNRIIGFAVCFVLLLEDGLHDVGFMREFRLRGRTLSPKLTFEFDGHAHILPNNDQLIRSLQESGASVGHFKRDHTFLWKYYLDSASIDKWIFHALNFTLEIHDKRQSLRVSLQVKECGICPLYNKENR